MRTMILLAALTLPSSAPGSPSAPPEAARQAPADAAAGERECVRAGVQMADRPRGRIEMRRLDELPAGRLELTVMRQMNGCVVPAVVREGIGR